MRRARRNFADSRRARSYFPAGRHQFSAQTDPGVRFAPWRTSDGSTAGETSMASRAGHSQVSPSSEAAVGSPEKRFPPKSTTRRRAASNTTACAARPGGPKCWSSVQKRPSHSPSAIKAWDHVYKPKGPKAAEEHAAATILRHCGVQHARRAKLRRLPPQRAVPLPGVVQDLVLSGPSEEHNAGAYRVVGHRMSQSSGRSTLFSLTPRRAVPPPGVPPKSVGSVTTKQDDRTARIITRHRVISSRRRTLLSHLRPVHAVPYPRIFQSCRAADTAAEQHHLLGGGRHTPLHGRGARSARYRKLVSNRHRPIPTCHQDSPACSALQTGPPAAWRRRRPWHGPGGVAVRSELSASRKRGALLMPPGGSR